MRIRWCAAAASAAVCVQVAIGVAQTRSLTLADVLARAREHAPQVVSARLAVEETRARRRGAALRFQSNPELDVALGNRNGPGGRFTDVEVGIAQALESGGRRAARLDSVNAAIARDAAQVEEVMRTVLRSAAAAFYRAVHANERLRLLDAAERLAAEVHATADRRFKAGDIAVLDVHIARASLARIRADRQGAQAGRALAIGELRQLLSLDADIDLAGSLDGPAPADLDAALRSAARRPELRVIEAAIEEADADVRLGLSLAKPAYGLGVRYAREEGDQIVLGGLTVTLPLFSNGQEARAVGSARAARLRAELEAARLRIREEVRAAFASYDHRLAAVHVLETDAIPGLDENERLTARSFEAGQLGVPELLLVRREIVDTRVQFIDALLEAALARIDLDASAGVLR